MKYRINRMEIAGSLGDLGVLLPIAVGMVLVNNLPPTGVFLAIGLYYIFSGMYFGVTTPVQPMKVIGSYAVAMALSPGVIQASGLWVGMLLLVIGLSGAMKQITRFVPRVVIRGVQLSTGVLLLAQGVRLILGTSSTQTQAGASEPFMVAASLGGVQLSWIFGLIAVILTLFLINNRRYPAATMVVGFGFAMGLLLGEGVPLDSLGLHLPDLFPMGFPDWAAFSTALFVLALPQLPMTIGNAVLANEDLAREYFADDASRITGKALCVSMGLANIGSFVLGGIPMCHGAGGLAAHYRFGARTAGSNLFIGGLFVITSLVFGPQVLAIVKLVPLSVLGALLVFAGAQLAMTVRDVGDRKEFFVCMSMLGITLASNLALGYLVGIGLHYLLRRDMFDI
jgi:SulP family sulfate permease